MLYYMMKLHIVPLLVLLHVGCCKSHATTGGYWQLLLENTGVSAMHKTLTHENTVLIFDQTEAGPHQYPLRHRGRCARSTSHPSCYAHSIEYDIATNFLRPLTLDRRRCRGRRVMNNMLALPRGDVLILNGATRGAAGWENAIDPSLQPYMYNPDYSEGRRFSLLRGTEIPRMYHSTAVLPGGRILVAGSNPHVTYELNAAFPTELRMEAFTPYYMAEQFDDRRPVSLLVGYSGGVAGVRHGEEFFVRFRLRGRMGSMGFSMYSPPFSTHSFSMNQRLLKVECRRIEKGEEGVVAATLVAPPTAKVAPAGYYLLTVVNGEVPSAARWMRILLA